MKIWWIRRDLRLNDNQALAAAAGLGDPVLPLYILDPVFWRRGRVPKKRGAFLLSGLRSLDESLRLRGSRLIVRTGNPREVLAGLVAETGASAIYAEQDFTPYARRRDAGVANRLPLHLVAGLTVFPPSEVLKSDGTPYTVFTPFSKKWRALSPPVHADLLKVPGFIPIPDTVTTERIPGSPLESQPVLFPAGESEAERRLNEFVRERIYTYADNRNRPDLDATSGLSPYLRFGMLSARQAVVQARKAIFDAPDDAGAKSADVWLNELIWREFFHSILYHFPKVRRESFRSAFRDIPWGNDPADIEAWRSGMTGYPFVDAAMRQLKATGWMHNRARMVVASFLVKDLTVDWREGERWFMQQLVDGDVAANNGGWQWSAGTGTDAAPYFRIFNPVTQSKKFDPDGTYIRRWIPELSDVPKRFIHEPWKMPMEIQVESGCTIGADYPEPIIDHKWARERALDTYNAVR